MDSPSQAGNGYFENTRPEMTGYLPESLGRVLEVGCGAGAFAAHLGGATEHWGIEPDPDAARRAQDRGLRVVVGTFQEVAGELPVGAFDTVVCNDVIEHMTDHDEFLADIRRYMSPDGVIVGSVPNVRHLPHLVNLLVKKDWEYTDDGTLDRTHLRYFTEKSLRRSLTEADFEIVRVAGINGAARRPTSRRGALQLAAVLAFNLVTLWQQRDAEFLQIAFAATRGPDQT